MWGICQKFSSRMFLYPAFTVVKVSTYRNDTLISLSTSLKYCVLSKLQVYMITTKLCYFLYCTADQLFQGINPEETNISQVLGNMEIDKRSCSTFSPLSLRIFQLVSDP